MTSDVVELPTERFVLGLEQLVRHLRRLEHREHVRAPVGPSATTRVGKRASSSSPGPEYMSMTPLAASIVK
jgi:hypothetical protein